MIVNEKAEENIIELKEGDRTESDHVPLELEIEGPGIEGIGQGRKKRIIEKSMWTQEEIENYRARCEGWACGQEENEEIWKEIKEKVKNSITKIKKEITPWKIGRKE